MIQLSKGNQGKSMTGLPRTLPPEANLRAAGKQQELKQRPHGRYRSTNTTPVSFDLQAKEQTQMPGAIQHPSLTNIPGDKNAFWNHLLWAKESFSHETRKITFIKLSPGASTFVEDTATKQQREVKKKTIPTSNYPLAFLNPKFFTFPFHGLDKEAMLAKAKSERNNNPSSISDETSALQKIQTYEANQRTGNVLEATFDNTFYDIIPAERQGDGSYVFTFGDDFDTAYFDPSTMTLQFTSGAVWFPMFYPVPPNLLSSNSNSRGSVQRKQNSQDSTFSEFIDYLNNNPVPHTASNNGLPQEMENKKDSLESSSSLSSSLQDAAGNAHQSELQAKHDWGHHHQMKPNQGNVYQNATLFDDIDNQSETSSGGLLASVQHYHDTPMITAPPPRPTPINSNRLNQQPNSVLSSTNSPAVFPSSSPSLYAQPNSVVYSSSTETITNLSTPTLPSTAQRLSMPNAIMTWTQFATVAFWTGLLISLIVAMLWIRRLRKYQCSPISSVPIE